MFAILTTRSQPILSQFQKMLPVNPCLSHARVSSSFFLPVQQAVTQLRHYAPVPAREPLPELLYDTKGVGKARAGLLEWEANLKTIRKGCQILLKRIEDNPHPNSHEAPTQHIDLKERIKEIDRELEVIKQYIQVLNTSSKEDPYRWGDA